MTILILPFNDMPLIHEEYQDSLAQSFDVEFDLSTYTKLRFEWEIYINHTVLSQITTGYIGFSDSGAVNCVVDDQSYYDDTSDIVPLSNANAIALGNLWACNLSTDDNMTRIIAELTVSDRGDSHGILYGMCVSGSDAGSTPVSTNVLGAYLTNADDILYTYADTGLLGRNITTDSVLRIYGKA